MFNMGQHQAIHKIIKPFCKLIGIIQPDKRGHVCQQFSLVPLPERKKGFPLFILFHILQLQFYGDQLRVQLQNLLTANVDDFASPGLIALLRKSTSLQSHSQPYLLAENTFG